MPFTDRNITIGKYQCWFDAYAWYSGFGGSGNELRLKVYLDAGTSATMQREPFPENVRFGRVWVESAGQRFEATEVHPPVSSPSRGAQAIESLCVIPTDALNEKGRAVTVGAEVLLTGQRKRVRAEGIRINEVY